MGFGICPGPFVALCRVCLGCKASWWRLATLRRWVWGFRLPISSLASASRQLVLTRIRPAFRVQSSGFLWFGFWVNGNRRSRDFKFSMAGILIMRQPKHLVTVNDCHELAEGLESKSPKPQNGLRLACNNITETFWALGIGFSALKVWCSALIWVFLLGSPTQL